MRIEELNPWWKTGKIEDELELLPVRDLFQEIIPYLEEKQTIALTGLRRTGKTVLLHHLISFLLKKFPQENIFYFNFDLLNEKIEDILESYRQITGINWKNEKVFVFLDEIQKHSHWENELKVLYDHFPRLKFFISGSASLFIEKKTKESLAGRVFSFVLNPLSFKEYLRLKNIKFDFSKISLYREELVSALEHYSRIGGFPELLNTKEGIKIDRYIKETVVDRVIFIDIPNVFEIEEPELLVKLFTIVASSPGLITDYEGLASDLKRNRKTISNYFFYLEKAFLVKKIYNYSRNLLTGEKKAKRLYPFSTAFAYLYKAEEGRIIETLVLAKGNFTFFSRMGGKEVDFIDVADKIVPIEVKYSKAVKEKEIKGLLYFMKKQNIQEGLVVTADYEREEKIKGKTIRFVPLWKYLLEF